ncbi:DMT family transporter [uncultured Limnohabitans sp.]|jgi:drug/metabolite transporter (DMT)-like permease|uniref:DMT family transporter n=1 Tax=uncultured Limnohabitans sp. TaxID=768543 RepID=UPI002602E390|nr:DMT family transporter [uncultured Limnohabitans sp.]
MKPRKAFFSPPRQWLLAHHRSRRSFAAWPVAVRGMVWMVCGGLLFSMLNTIARQLTLHLDVYQSQFLRYLFGLLVILPWVFRDGWRTYMPVNMAGQFWRGGVHTVGLILWFTALPQIPLADMTAIGFTGPIFIMIGAAWFLGEPMRKDRWIAAIVGFAGVLVVVLPKMSGDGGWFNLVMLASSPVFAASFLITKALTRYEKPGVIVLWQALTVSVLSLPMALPHWQMPTPLQWLGFAATGVLGTLAHYCLTRAFALADISATQSLRFLDLVWASVLGWLVFGDVPSQSTWLGAFVILWATVWIARREGKRPTVVSD